MVTIRRGSLDSISHIWFHALRVAPPRGDKEAIGFWMKVRNTQRRVKEINLMTTALKHKTVYFHTTINSAQVILRLYFLSLFLSKNEVTQSSNKFFLKIQACDFLQFFLPGSTLNIHFNVLIAKICGKQSFCYFSVQTKILSAFSE